VPVLVNERRQKLSKRRDRVAVEDYRDLGVLPEAMVNFLALLGWGPGDDREVLERSELVERFRLEDVNRSPAFFDEKKLFHFNGLYIRALARDEFVRRVRPFLEHTALWPKERFDDAAFLALAPLVQERVALLSEAAGLLEFLFATPFVPDPDALERAIRADDAARQILEAAAAGFATATWDAASLRAVVEGIAADLGRKLARTQAPIRVATMGRTVGLPLFESLEVLGREATLERLAAQLRS